MDHDDKRFQHDRKLVAFTLRSLAEQIETGHIDGVKLEWKLGDEVLKTELLRTSPEPLKVISLKVKA